MDDDTYTQLVGMICLQAEYQLIEYRPVGEPPFDLILIHRASEFYQHNFKALRSHPYFRRAELTATLDSQQGDTWKVGLIFDRPDVPIATELKRCNRLPAK